MWTHNKEIPERNSAREERQVLKLPVKQDDTDKAYILFVDEENVEAWQACQWKSLLMTCKWDVPYEEGFECFLRNWRVNSDSPLVFGV